MLNTYKYNYHICEVDLFLFDTPASVISKVSFVITNSYTKNFKVWFKIIRSASKEKHIAFFIQTELLKYDEAQCYSMLNLFVNTIVLVKQVFIRQMLKYIVKRKPCSSKLLTTKQGLRRILKSSESLFFSAFLPPFRRVPDIFFWSKPRRVHLPGCSRLLSRHSSQQTLGRDMGTGVALQTHCTGGPRCVALE